MSILDAALQWRANGYSIIPIRADGTKKPVFEWKRFQQEIASEPNLRLWLRDPALGIAIVCGKVSGNLEMLELEGRLVNDHVRLRAMYEALNRHDLDPVFDLLMDGLSAESPSGGTHFFYRIADADVPGNTKVARRPSNADELAANPDQKIQVLIETRGEGGFVVAAPSGGQVHPTGKEWRLLNGTPATIPTITWEQRCKLLDVLTATLDEMPQRAPAPVPLPAVLQNSDRGALRVGDDYNQRANWADILEPHGWQYSHQVGNETFWSRPGKEVRAGHSASTGYVAGQDRLFVWSSSTPFDPETPYNKFAAYALLNHNQDFAAATRDLGRQGYGDALATRPKAATSTWEAGGDWAPQPVKPPAPVASRPARRESFTDVGTANRFIREHADQFLYLKGAKGDGKWLWYNGFTWTPDETGCQVADAIEILIDTMSDEADRFLADPDQAAVGKALDRYVHGARMNSGRKGLLATIAAKLTISPQQMNPHKHLIGLRNGVLDVRTGTVIAADPKFLITRSLGAAYDPAATAPRTEKFLAEVLPDFRFRDYVQRGIGYTLTGEQNQRAFFILHGDPGTGKSQFLELFNHMFGGYARGVADGAFRKKAPGSTGPSAELHALRSSRYAFTSESDDDVVFDADVVKRICGGDTMSTRTLYEAELQDWRAECVVWMATNHFPRFPADEEAVWDRVKAIPFDVKFPQGDGRIVAIADELYEHEASGILNLMLAWLRDYRDQGLTEPGAVKEAVQARQDDGNPVKAFWDELVGCGEMVADEEADTPFAYIYQHYVSWYTDSWGKQPMGSRRFGNLLRKCADYQQLTKRNGQTHVPGWKKMNLRGFRGTF
jgi:P4 family phage/plasmid primase-like protien